MNICFTSRNSRCKRIFSKNATAFHEVFEKPPEFIDLLVLDGGNLEYYLENEVDTCIFKSENITDLLQLKKVRSAVSCGMSPYDSVTFSSIGEDSSVICIRRPISFMGKVYEPCEFKVPFDYSIGIFHNLVIGLLSYFVSEE
ncbi:MAG: hypothetical protein E7582_05385 [Ruminococcaceae bacterium]|nr:hypothetical protein [Oscillospiraceae bacterium]